MKTHMKRSKKDHWIIGVLDNWITRNPGSLVNNFSGSAGGRANLGRLGRSVALAPLDVDRRRRPDRRKRHDVVVVVVVVGHVEVVLEVAQERGAEAFFDMDGLRLVGDL